MTTARNIALLALTYVAAIALGFLLYIALIRSTLLSNISILFYRGIMVAAIAAVLMLVAGVLLRRHVRLDRPTLVGAIALSLSCNLCFLITFPVTFDRSITMFLLARIEREDGRLDNASLEKLYIREYLQDMRQIDRRVEEQLLSGNIRIDHGHIRITPQGRHLLAGGRTIGRWFGADPRFVTAPPAPPPTH